MSQPAVVNSGSVAKLVNYQVADPFVARSAREPRYWLLFQSNSDMNQPFKASSRRTPQIARSSRT